MGEPKLTGKSGAAATVCSFSGVVCPVDKLHRSQISKDF
jgi:hypothetical protein